MTQNVFERCDLIFVVLAGRGNLDDLRARGNRMRRLNVQGNLEVPAQQLGSVGVERWAFGVDNLEIVGGQRREPEDGGGGVRVSLCVCIAVGLHQSNRLSPAVGSLPNQRRESVVILQIFRRVGHKLNEVDPVRRAIVDGIGASGRIRRRTRIRKGQGKPQRLQGILFWCCQCDIGRVAEYAIRAQGDRKRLFGKGLTRQWILRDGELWVSGGTLETAGRGNQISRRAGQLCRTDKTLERGCPV